MPTAVNLTFPAAAFDRCKEIAELNEKQSRILLGCFASLMGHGGQKAVAETFGVAINTVRAGREEFEGTRDVTNAENRIRRSGAGRKSSAKSQPGLLEELTALLENNSYGDPERVLFWTTLSLRDLEEALKNKGFKVSYVTVGKLLEELGYSKQLNQKMEQIGEPHPDRDAQFRNIDLTVRHYLREGNPVISVDCKKKELLDNFKNNGRGYRRKGDARRVLDHDFPLKELGKVVPYGVYVLNDNTGFVNLTTCSDTSEFAVESIRAWWLQIGKVNFPNAKKILIACDGGGSNGCRVRLWKEQLAQLAQETGIEFTVCHFPPGTSKWNKVEHRLFCYISKNWEGKPLLDIPTVVSYIGNTTTKSGPKVDCRVDPREYRKGLRVSDEQMANLDIEPIGEFGKWNYIVRGFKSDRLIRSSK